MHTCFSAVGMVWILTSYCTNLGPHSLNTRVPLLSAYSSWNGTAKVGVSSLNFAPIITCIPGMITGKTWIWQVQHSLIIAGTACGKHKPDARQFPLPWRLQEVNQIATDDPLLCLSTCSPSTPAHFPALILIVQPHKSSSHPKNTG